MKHIFTSLALVALLFSSSAYAMQGMEGMDHSNMDKDPNMHVAMVDGIHAEFQVMSLAAMNTTDPDGKTHHVMATFTKGDKKITKVIGKLKLVAPSGKEQLADLKDFGNGVFAANFTIDEPGKWGAICLFKDDSGQHTVKFHHQNNEK